MSSSTANATMVRRYGDDIRLFRSFQSRAAMTGLFILFVFAPLMMSDFQNTVIDYAGIAAIGALGLNLLVGFTGQISLGHAFFIGTGAYTAAYLGSQHGLPFVVWLPAAALVGALIGMVIGPAALRLRGNYLAIITLGLVFLGQHIFENWTSVTGGLNGTPVSAPVSIGPVNFADLHVLGRTMSRNQGYFYLIWALVALVALATKNLVRSRTGRAMQAVRDRDLAAEVVGVPIARAKILAFVISSSLAAMAGGLYGSYQQFVSPDEFSLFLSIQYIVMIIVGGIATTFGPIIGAMFITAVPRVVETFVQKYGNSIPGITTSGGGHGLTVFALNQIVFGVLIIVFFMVEPRGLAALWLRVKAYFRAWPFSY